MSATNQPQCKADCKHHVLRFTCSSHARDAGFTPRTPLQRLAATLPSDRAPKKADRPSEDQYPASTFPAPLVLPHDELSWDPEYDPQSLKSWIDEPERNDVSPSRRTIYLVPTPAVTPSTAHVREWAIPRSCSKTGAIPPTPKIADVHDYLQAFYHGLPVKTLGKPSLKFVSWSNTPSQPTRIGLNIGSEVIGIRTRPSKDDLFSRQLNLEDLLDAAIAILPKDAYALLMLTDHDLYEDDDDDFCCGRAYGGSRVAVVSTARYNPILDQDQHVETEHAWPASHCQTYIDMCCDDAPHKKKHPSPATPSVMQSALSAFSSLKPPQSYRDLSTLWLSRLCKTASHELGHCFGMDHCVYYACIMQGTSGLTEDVRQPPHLCPVDLAKVLHATATNPSQRYRALLGFCERFADHDRMFAAFAAWLRGRVGEMGSRREDIVLV